MLDRSECAISFQDFHEKMPDFSGKKVQFCTVRQPTVAGLSMGTLYWLLQAERARIQGADVTVTDFYDAKMTDGSAVRTTEKLLHKTSSRQSGASTSPKSVIQSAEDVPRNMQAWHMFCDYVRSHRDSRSSWGVIGTVNEGIDAILETQSYDVPASMERFLEELSVWSSEVDNPNAVQIFHHEVEITDWTKRLFPNASKTFLQVALPMANEFRGKYKLALEGGGEVTVQRRIGDLAAKLAESNFEPSEESSALSLFYSILFDEFIAALSPENTEDFRPRYVIWSLLQIDPALVPFYIERFGRENIQQLGLCGHLDFDYTKEVTKEDFSEALFKGMTLMVRRALQREVPPSWGRIKTIIGAMPEREYCYPSPSNSRSFRKQFDDLIASPSCPVEEVVHNFWLPLTEIGNDGEKSSLFQYDYFWGHPVSDRIAKELDGSSETWNKVYGVCRDAFIGPMMLLRGNMLHVPLFRKFVDEAEKRDVELLFVVPDMYLYKHDFGTIEAFNHIHMTKESRKMYLDLLRRYITHPQAMSLDGARRILDRYEEDEKEDERITFLRDDE